MKRFLLPFALCASAFWTAPADAGLTGYLALGDSLAFGVGTNDSPTDVSNGDRGYVGDYANTLASLNNGTRPRVINLGVSGESSSSFFGNGIGLDGSDASKRNTNYTGSPLPSQDALMLSTIAAQQAAGNTISTVSISLGANDLFIALATGSPFDQTLAAFQHNELTLLTQIRTLLPSANLLLLGYYDPYAPFVNDPKSPFYGVAQASSLAIPAINQYLVADAAAFQASYVDLATPFRGHELEYTYIATGNVHPNSTGYLVIANSMAMVPEPSSVVLLGLGLSAAAGRFLWRGRRAA